MHLFHPFFLAISRRFSISRFLKIAKIYRMVCGYSDINRLFSDVSALFSPQSSFFQQSWGMSWYQPSQAFHMATSTWHATVLLGWSAQATQAMMRLATCAGQQAFTMGGCFSHLPWTHRHPQMCGGPICTVGTRTRTLRGVCQTGGSLALPCCPTTVMAWWWASTVTAHVVTWWRCSVSTSLVRRGRGNSTIGESS